MTSPQGSIIEENVLKFCEKSLAHTDPETGLRPYSKFEKIMTTKWGYYCWKIPEEKINVRDHVRFLEHEKIYSRQEVKEEFSKLAKVMGKDKPQWEFIIFPKFDDGIEIRTLLVIKLMHCYMDGLSIVMAFKKLFTPALEYTINPLTFQIPRRIRIYMITISIIYFPFFLTHFMIRKSFHTFWNIENSHPRQKYFSWLDYTKTIPIKVSMVRNIRKWSKSTVSNVITLAVLKSMRNNLQRRIPRDEITISELTAMLPYPNYYPQNRFSFITYGMPATNKIQGDLSDAQHLLQELQHCRDTASEALRGPGLYGTFMIEKILNRVPYWLTPLSIKGPFQSLMVSNAPFSRISLELPDGNPIYEAMGFTPQVSDIGLTIFIRYGENINIYSCADSDWMSDEDLEKFTNDIPLEIKKMGEIMDTCESEV